MGGESPETVGLLVAVALALAVLFLWLRHGLRTTRTGFLRIGGFYIAVETFDLASDGAGDRARVTWLARNETTTPYAPDLGGLRLLVDGVEWPPEPPPSRPDPVPPRGVGRVQATYPLPAGTADRLRRQDAELGVTWRYHPDAPAAEGAVSLDLGWLLSRAAATASGDASSERR